MNTRDLRIAWFGALRRRAVILLISACAAPLLFGGTAVAKPKYAAIAIDGNTGRVLYSRSADRRRYPASLTKIMTLYVLFEYLDNKKLGLRTKLIVTPHASGQTPSKLGLKPGQTIRVIDAIRALVTKSANDAAVVIAENIAGTERNFARLMTAKARQLGMSRTTFRNASGLPNSEQVTTARDMATLGRRIQQDFPQYYAYFKTKYFRYRGKRYRNHNRLLFSYRGTDGIKTGYTRASGFNLTSSVKRGDKHVIAVVIGGRSARARNASMASILNKTLPKAIARSRIKTVPLPTRNPRVLLAKTREYQVAALSAAPKPKEVEFEQPPLRTAGSKPSPMLIAAPAGTHHVQVGAYTSRAEAAAQIDAVRAKAGDLLNGHSPLTMVFKKRKKNLYRARFASFDEAAARAMCGRLKGLRINCVVMRAE